ncbi:unnamed protein product [Cylicocyclus nassatus]|uniref:Low-density lipoprotein receptor domain class A n=1 Tax=Cylicocyclus nassatus TaxID=53992 RepID=A0AA36H5R3_CYLNA|nr:unnamed protein product [Cylicocyclus nassatus]
MRMDLTPKCIRIQASSRAIDTRFRYGIKGRKCPSTWFFCADGSNCIISRYVCDDHKDCRDGSDEAEFCHGLNEKKRKASDKIVY